MLPLHFGWLLLLSLYKEDYLQIFNVCPFDYTAFAVSGQDLVPVNWFIYIGWMTVVTQTDRPTSVRNRLIIEGFGGVFVLSIGFRIFCSYKGFCHKTESNLLLFLQECRTN